MGFIRQLNDCLQLDGLIDFLDLLLSGQHFDDGKGWTKNRIGQFTKAVKRLPRIAKDNWVVASQKQINWQNINNTDFHIVLSGGDAEGRLLLRHLRNSIAHGNCILIHNNGRINISLKDYSDNSHKQQSADMLFPLDMLHDIYHLYQHYQSQPTTGLRKKRKHTVRVS